jgi:8-oxo-dGTP pyrophosphatase MutT (NUDIX family)
MLRASAGGVVVRQNGTLVIVEQNANSWSLPKGGIEPGENELDTARREIFEETGIKDLTLIRELGSYERYSLDKDGVHENISAGLRPRTFFLFSTNQEVLEPQDREVTAARWVTIEEALKMLTHPKDREFLKSVIERIKAASF